MTHRLGAPACRCERNHRIRPRSGCPVSDASRFTTPLIETHERGLSSPQVWTPGATTEGPVMVWIRRRICVWIPCSTYLAMRRPGRFGNSDRERESSANVFVICISATDGTRTLPRAPSACKICVGAQVVRDNIENSAAIRTTS